MSLLDVFRPTSERVATALADATRKRGIAATDLATAQAALGDAAISADPSAVLAAQKRLESAQATLAGADALLDAVKARAGAAAADDTRAAVAARMDRVRAHAASRAAAAAEVERHATALAGALAALAAANDAIRAEGIPPGAGAILTRGDLEMLALAALERAGWANASPYPWKAALPSIAERVATANQLATLNPDAE